MGLLHRREFQQSVYEKIYSLFIRNKIEMASKLPALTKTLVEFSKPRLATFAHYAKVELVPPSPGEIVEVSKSVGRLIKSTETLSWRHLTVKEATVNSLIAVEVACWFFIGECIGKGNIVGYQV